MDDELICASLNMLDISQGLSESNTSDVATMKECAKELRATHATFRSSHAIERVGTTCMDDQLGYALSYVLEIMRDAFRNALKIDVQVHDSLPSNASKKIATLESSDNNDHSIEVLVYGMRIN